MSELTPKEDFLASLNRCEESEDFLTAFYGRFLDSSQDVRDKFRYTEFRKQKAMLSKSLQLAAGATNGEAESLQDLHERSKTHDRWHHNIKPEMYELWLESLIQTAQEFDPEWNETTESHWRSILGHVIAHMVKRY